MDDLSVCIPEYNENHEVLKKLKEDLTSLGVEVIIVDDGSTIPYPDAIKHGANFGYGSALMTAIKNSTRDLVMTIDGDGQHTIGQVIKLYHAFKISKNSDMMVGQRKLKRESFIRYSGRIFLNIIASLICLRWLVDLNSGARIFKRHIVLGYLPILCRRFSFTTSLTLSMICDGYEVDFFPIEIEPRTYGITNVKIIQDGLITFYYILRNGFALRTRTLRKWLRKLRGKKE